MIKVIVYAAVAFGLGMSPVVVTAQDKSKQLSFKEMDTNGNATVDAKEWKAGGRNPKMFAKIDTNGDGEISQAEMRVQQELWKAEREARKGS